MFDNKISWSVNWINNNKKWALAIDSVGTIQRNPIPLLTYWISINSKVQSKPIFKISSGGIKILCKSFICYLPIIIDNTFHIIYGIRTPFIYLLCFDYFFLSHQSLFMILAYWFTIILLFSIFFLAYSFFNAYGRILPIFIFRIYIYNIYHCQEWISYYLDIFILKSTIL